MYEEFGNLFFLNISCMPIIQIFVLMLLHEVLLLDEVILMRFVISRCSLKANLN